MGKEDSILRVMHRLALQIQENGLLTYAVLEELWEKAYKEGRQAEQADELEESGRD